MKKLSVIIPVFNEQSTVETILKKVFAAPTPGFEKEIIVVNDGSTDQSFAILTALRRDWKFVLVSHEKNLGKGAAIRTGLTHVSGQVVLIQDADLECSPDDYPNLLKKFEEGNPIVYGSRNLDESKTAGRKYFLAFWGGKFLTKIFNLLFGTTLTDLNTAYKLFRADIIKNIDLREDGFSFCEEISAKCCRAGYRIAEVAISYHPRKFSEGKKTRYSDGISGLWVILKCWFG